MPLTIPAKAEHRTFLYSEPCLDLDALSADIAYLGIPYGASYTFGEIANDQSRGALAMRRATDRILRSIERYDFDLGGPMYDHRPIRAVDCGDVYADPREHGDHLQRAEEVVRKIVASGALPIILGGDHSIPIPVIKALDTEGPITLIQLDQHLDWREEINGVTQGLSSPIRRASEMDHVGEIFQIGLHATGSGRQEEFDAAEAYGAHLVSAYDLHDHGVEPVLDMIPDGGRYYITVDLDAFEPGGAPGVAAPCAGGMTFLQARKLIHGLVKKGRVVGMDVVEITPATDVNQITCITAGRLIVNLIGAAVRANYFEGRAGKSGV
ncbi:agmatinase (plasmid) [Brucella anthropi]|uniref:Arginase/agmatinase/formiminoglutamase n=1 Tax=Brucella anthropi (strain ATCC 49188 / DSM 6882 / CCUG 24695 / JCM 21032 / LMG 3331 / NBRC 15819 / NCTC 12168 / Alc 37) TaxID=439375 RepID=A6X7J4_BRUA4|nr:agmatinase [Brucella anthropi]ABS17198.1 Arginase/agmatinase/formiminoglutamase [Brucella anthropi ATCC 49188]KAB2729173.1 arginase [Brucella anthropi]QQC26857.1 agmatinase [Brucella anthropi]SUB55903.1 Agmatinase [Brucella anthropi]